MKAVDAVLAAARQAPTARNIQPAVFVVVREPASQAEIVRLAAADRAQGVLHWPMPWLAEATVHIAVLYDTRRREPGVHGDRTALLGIGAAAESMRIASDAAGAAWTEWRPSEVAERALRTLLGFSADFECHLVAGLVPERPAFPPPPSLATPFAETYGHADPLLRIGPVARGAGEPVDVLLNRRTASGHFVSAPLQPEVVRALVSGAARAGRAAGLAAPRLVYVQSPTEIGKLADVMFEVATPLLADQDYNRQVAAWQSTDEAEWRKRGEGTLVTGKGVAKLFPVQAKGLWNRISAAFGGTGIEEMVKETLSELVREAPLVIAWVLDPAGRVGGRRTWAAAVLDAGASTMRTLYDATRLGLGAEQVTIMLERTPQARPDEGGEARVRRLLAIPDGHEVVNVVRVGKPDTEDTPPSIKWRGGVRRDPSQVVFQEKFTGS